MKQRTLYGILKKINAFLLLCIRKILLILRQITYYTLNFIIMIPILAYGVAAFAGIGASEIIENIFVRRQTPQQAVTGINWVRLAISAVIVGVAIYFVATKFLKK